MKTDVCDPATLTDQELVARHLAGDVGAFAEIVTRHQAAVCAVTFCACGDASRSEDLAQEVFLRAWRKLGDLREPEKLRAWLCGLARNIARELRRTERRSPAVGGDALDVEFADDTSGPREHAIRAEERALLWRLLEEIPETYREPLVLYYRERQSAAAVAEALEISEEAVRQRIVRGRAMLGERMESLVAESLGQTRPGPAFTRSVLAALPAAFTFAKGVTTSVSGAAALPGGAGKLLAGAGLLPIALNTFLGCLGYRAALAAAKTAEARRLVTLAHVALYSGLGLSMAGVVAAIALSRAFGWSNSWTYGFVLIGLTSLPVAIGLFLMQRWLRRAYGGTTRSVNGAAGNSEFRSQRTLLGLPLVHIRVGGAPRARFRPVKAWFAIGDVAVGVVFAGGGFAVAPISIGGFALGLLSSGGIALGGVALGGMAAGVLAAGGMAAGLLAFGGLTWAPFTSDHFQHYASLALDASIYGWGLAWLPPLVFIGWSRWRERARGAG